MWKTLSRFFFWLCWLAVFWLGSVLYLAAIFPGMRTRVAEELAAMQQFVIVNPLQLAASVLLVLALLVLWCEYRLTNRRVTGLQLNTTEGAVVIDFGALEAYVNRVVAAQPNVRRVHVKTVADERRINVTVRVSVEDGIPVIPFIEGLQRTIRQRILSGFGTDLIRDIRIEIARVASTRTESVRLLGWRKEPPNAGDEPRADAPPAAG